MLRSREVVVCQPKDGFERCADGYVMKMRSKESLRDKRIEDNTLT